VGKERQTYHYGEEIGESAEHRARRMIEAALKNKPLDGRPPEKSAQGRSIQGKTGRATAETNNDDIGVDRHAITHGNT
jgi:hypothetical protein